MKNELLLLNEEHTETLIEQTKTKPQKTLDFVMGKQVKTFSFNPPINLAEERNWFLSVTSFEATNSVFKTTDEKNSASVTTPGPRNTEDGEELSNKLNNL